MKFYLGISAFYHDSAVALFQDDKLVFAIQEERISRKKHDSRFPRESIICLAIISLIFAINYLICSFILVRKSSNKYLES